MLWRELILFHLQKHCLYSFFCLPWEENSGLKSMIFSFLTCRNQISPEVPYKRGYYYYFPLMFMQLENNLLKQYFLYQSLLLHTFEKHLPILPASDIFLCSLFPYGRFSWMQQCLVSVEAQKNSHYKTTAMKRRRKKKGKNHLSYLSRSCVLELGGWRWNPPFYVQWQNTGEAKALPLWPPMRDLPWPNHSPVVFLSKKGGW